MTRFHRNAATMGVDEDTGTSSPAPSPALPKPSALQPLIDKVGVPLLWFGIGYLAATVIHRPRRVPKGDA